MLLLCEYPTLFGGERSLLSALPGVRASGFEIVAVAPPLGPLADALAQQHVVVLPLSTTDTDGVRLMQPGQRAELQHLIESVQPDLLHANSLAMGRLSGPVAERLKLPSLAHLRDIIRLSSTAIADLNAHRRLLAVSQATRAFHIAAGISAEKCVVLHNGVDLKQFQPRRPTGYLHRQLKISPDAQLVGTIGQIGLRKGLDILLDAAHEVAAFVPKVHWLIVGGRFSQKAESAALESRLFAAAHQSPLAGRLHLLGVRSDVDRILNELTLLVHPARQEPLGRVLLEAAAAGAPIIATDVGGTREIFCSPAATSEEGQAVRLVPSGDPVALARAIRALIHDSQARQQLSCAARQRAEQAFDVHRASAALVQHYRELLDTHSK